MSVGGTSGGSSGNLGINLGGLNVNFDLGPSTSAVASQAYAFLNSSFNSDSALLGNTITGSQDFLSSFATPVLRMAQQQQAFNTQELPGMFANLNAENFSLGQSALTSEQDIAQASIEANRASQAEANSAGGGGCYITTAVCESLSLPDDCYSLQTLRRFRDTYMMETNVRRSFVREYYQTAPAIVDRIRQRKDARMLFQRLYDDYILPAVIAIECGQLAGAFKIYRRMLYHVRGCVYG